MLLKQKQLSEQMLREQMFKIKTQFRTNVVKTDAVITNVKTYVLKTDVK
jgi:hypothetical protein